MERYATKIPKNIICHGAGIIKSTKTYQHIKLTSKKLTSTLIRNYVKNARNDDIKAPKNASCNSKIE
jgi:hypothetical protein